MSSRALHDRLLQAWRQDLGERLLAGAARTPVASVSGARWLSGWAGVCLILGLGLYLSGGNQTGFIALNTAAATWPEWLWVSLTILGDERVAFAIALLFALHYPRIFWALVLGALIAFAYSRGLKILVDAARPPAVLTADAFNLIGPGHRRHSFPSGHSVTVAVFFGILIYFTPRPSLRALFLTLAVLAGLSRVAVGVHWPVDVAAGLMGGALAAWLGAMLAARWPGPATDPRVHLILVGLSSILVARLLFDDGGYVLAALPLAVLGSISLLVVLMRYLVRPLLR